jgi:hypothetical protein
MALANKDSPFLHPPGIISEGISWKPSQSKGAIRKNRSTKAGRRNLFERVGKQVRQEEM